MDSTLKRRIAAAAAGVALLAGAGGAYAVSKSGSRGDERQAFLNDVAGRLNVTPDKLQAALDGALKDRLDAAVAAGRITRAQADDIERHATEHGGVPLLGGPGERGFHAGPPGFAGPPPPGAPPPGALPPGAPPPGPPGAFGGPPPFGPIGAAFDAAAKYLDLTDAQLRTKLESGKSLAQVAADQQKPVAGLKSAIEAGVKADLDKAVSGKRLTQQQEDRILTGLHSRIDEIVNRKPGDRPPRRLQRWRRGPHW